MPDVSAKDLHIAKAIAEQKSISRLLRQTKLAAEKLNLADAIPWLDFELNGYPAQEEPPAYRRVFSQRLEAYNEYRAAWQFAGQLEYAFKLRQPIEELEALSREEIVGVPVTKNFAIKNEQGDSFGTDWPQRFAIPGSQYAMVIEAVAHRWACQFEEWGLEVRDVRKLTRALTRVGESLEKHRPNRSKGRGRKG